MSHHSIRSLQIVTETLVGFSKMYCLVLGLAVLAATASPACATDSYDYVIVGAGTAGNVLANRLSQNPKLSVAVIDPGADQRGNPNVTNPIAWINNLGSPTDWAYQTTPQANASGRVIGFDAGKGIGGTSLINGNSVQSYGLVFY